MKKPEDRDMTTCITMATHPASLTCFQAGKAYKMKNDTFEPAAFKQSVLFFK